MHTFAYARSAVQHSVLVLLLLSTGAQAEVLFAPAVFITATPPPPAAESTRSGLLTTALQPAAATRQQPASSPPNPWIGPSHPQPSIHAPQPPKLRF